MTEATATMSAPEVVPLGRTDMNQNFWCYFCAEEIARHEILDVCVLKYAKMLEHIASEQHTKKTADFFRAHRVDESVCGRDEFSLQADKLKDFQMRGVHAVRRFEERDQHQIKMIAKKLRIQDKKRQLINQSDAWKTDPQQQQAPGHTPVYHDDRQSVDGVSTFSAHGDGLTFIGSQDFIEEEGNVHTGGIPPWLQGVSEDRGDGEIGPTMKEFQQHVASEQKKKLPACRVGANFDKSSAKSESWLPSFGQVWNSGRRLNSKKYFERETKDSHFLDKKSRTETPQETNWSGIQRKEEINSSIVQRKEEINSIGVQSKLTVVPYKSKRQKSLNHLTNGNEINSSLLPTSSSGSGPLSNGSYTNFYQ
ncbi:centrosomal AT-AC splicing factor-like isoform X2 [Argopecten irradians]